MDSVRNILNNYDFSKWVDHVEQFMTQYRLWPRGGGTAWVAVSGGKDSTLLLWTMYALFKRGRFDCLKLLHFNHQTRSGCREEEALVSRYGALLGLPLVKSSPSVPLGKKNVEYTARKERYAFFRKNIGSGDRVYMGHHLNDSFEWSLMARLKSGRLSPQLGIPVVNGAFARPFLCVTRDQISGMVKKIGLDWLEDDSNRELRFERNFLRTGILPSLKERFPGYLRHYVTSSNELARRLGYWRGTKKSFYRKNLPLGGVGLFNSRLESDFRGAEELIRGIVEELSCEKRGALGSQVNKMIEAAVRGRQGPIFFSGSVRGYMAPGVLFFVRFEDIGVWEQYDRTIVRVLEEKVSLEDIVLRRMEKGELLKHVGQMPFPPLGVGNIGKGWNPGGRHFLLPRTSSLFKERGWKLGSLVRMARDMKKDDDKSHVLPLDLLAQMGDFCCTNKNIQKVVKMEERI